MIQATLGLALLLASTTPVLSPPPTQPPAPAAETAAVATARPAAARETGSMETGDPDREVCKKVTFTGSRLGGERICRTAREWAELQRDSREATERKQRISGRIE